MDERISAFLSDLVKHLEGLPRKEIEAAENYYKEYLFDALEAGKDLDSVLAQLGSPRKIAAAIKTESSIIQTSKNPGLRNFTRVLKHTFQLVTTPLSITFLAVFVTASYSLVIAFFAVSLAAFIAAVAFAFGLAYQAFTAARQDTLAIIGALGLGLFGAGFLSAVSYLFFKLARLLIVFSMGLIRLMTRKPGGFVPQADSGQEKKKHEWKRGAVICMVPMLAGLFLFSVSGLPVKYWLIFNSMKPQIVAVKTAEFDPAQVSKISLTTTHTNIRLVPGTGDKITLSYEQVDWLEPEMALNGKELYFKEKSNGRLPLFQLVQLHENSAELTVSIPEGSDLQSVDVESYGGFVYIKDLTENIKVKTVSGRIHLDNTGMEEAYNLRAATNVGTIEVDGTIAGVKTDSGLRFDRDTGAGKTIELESVRGGISIKP